MRINKEHMMRRPVSETERAARTPLAEDDGFGRLRLSHGNNDKRVFPIEISAPMKIKDPQFSPQPPPRCLAAPTVKSTPSPHFLTFAHMASLRVIPAAASAPRVFTCQRCDSRWQLFSGDMNEEPAFRFLRAGVIEICGPCAIKECGTDTLDYFWNRPIPPTDEQRNEHDAQMLVKLAEFANGGPGGYVCGNRYEGCEKDDSLGTKCRCGDYRVTCIFPPGSRK